MRTVFADTVGLVALWNRSDQWHPAASAAFQGLDARHTRLVTTTYVLLECGNAAARRPYRSEVLTIRQNLRATRHRKSRTTAAAQSSSEIRLEGSDVFADGQLGQFRPTRRLEHAAPRTCWATCVTTAPPVKACRLAPGPEAAAGAKTLGAV